MIIMNITQKNNKSQIDRMMIARSRLFQILPRWGLPVARLRLEEDLTCQTCWTDGRTLGFNPEFTATLPSSQLIGIIAHEAEHIMRKHHLRMQGLNHSIFNVAADLVVNGELQHHYRFNLPDIGCTTRDYVGWSVEAVYRELMHNAQKIPVPLYSTSGQPNSKDDQSNKNDQSDPDGQNDQSNQDNQSDQNDQDNQDNQSASDSNQKSKKQQDQKKDPGGCGEIRPFTPEKKKEDGSLKSHDEIQEEINKEIFEIDRSITQAIMAQERLNKRVGNSTGNVSRQTKELLEGNVDVNEILKQFVAASSKKDYSFRKPNRRYSNKQIILPSLCKNGIESLIVMIDASGSISVRELDIYSSIMNKMLEEFPEMTLYAYYFDTVVKNTEIFTIQDTPVKFITRAGGGTSYVDVFSRVEEDEIEPIGTVVFTDLECSRYPESFPHYPVLWVVTPSNMRYIPSYYLPKFGEVFQIDKNQWETLKRLP